MDQDSGGLPAYAADMHRTLAEDLEHLPALLQAARDFALREVSGLDGRPVAHLGEAPAPTPLPAEGTGAEGALARFAGQWAPGFSGSAGPRYLGFVTGGATPASLTGDWLTGAYDQNVSGSGGSFASALEHETLGWLRELFGLSEEHRGAFVSGATVSNTVGLAIAREWLGERRGVSVAHEEAGRSAGWTCCPAVRTPVSPRLCPFSASAGTACARCRCCPAIARPLTWNSSTRR